jgi:acetylglutamate kinase
MTDPALQADFAEDVCVAQAGGYESSGVRGGGPQIEAALNRLGKKGNLFRHARYG